MRKEAGADAMLPEFAPGKGALGAELLEIFDDGRDQGKLPDLPDAEVKYGFLNAGDGRAESVIDGIDQAQQAGGQAGVAADNFADLGGITVFGQNEAQKAFIDAA